MNHDPVRQALQELIDARAVDYKAVSTAIGRNHAFIQQFMKRGVPRELNERDRERLADFFGVPAATFRARPGSGGVTTITDRGIPTGFIRAPVRLPSPQEMPQDVPVYGTAAGSVEGAFQLGEAIVDYVRRPPALMGAAEAYAIYIEGDSMEPMIMRGDLRFVHPHRPVHVGDTVVVQVKNGAHEPVLAYIKTLVSRAGGKIVLRQMNPQRDLEFDESKVMSIHKVLTMNELFGV